MSDISLLSLYESVQETNYVAGKINPKLGYTAQLNEHNDVEIKLFKIKAKALVLEDFLHEDDKLSLKVTQLLSEEMPIFITGCEGVGKTSLTKILQRMDESVSCTCKDNAIETGQMDSILRSIYSGEKVISNFTAKSADTVSNLMESSIKASEVSGILLNGTTHLAVHVHIDLRRKIERISIITLKVLNRVFLAKPKEVVFETSFKEEESFRKLAPYLHLTNEVDKVYNILKDNESCCVQGILISSDVRSINVELANVLSELYSNTEDILDLNIRTKPLFIERLLQSSKNRMISTTVCDLSVQTFVTNKAVTLLNVALGATGKVKSISVMDIMPGEAMTASVKKTLVETDTLTNEYIINV